jgi:glutathione S-transferase
MILIHHLNNSRSQRLLWLLEEMGEPYELVTYQRDPITNLAPPALHAVHPLGKAPVMEHDGRVIAESGVAMDYLARTFGGGAWAPAPGSPEHWRYQEWLHWAEGSLMLPLMLGLYVGFLGEGGAPLHPRIASETKNQLDHFQAAIQPSGYILESGISAADLQICFCLEAAAMRGRLDGHPGVLDWLNRLRARPAYAAAIARGGPYAMAPA